MVTREEGLSQFNLNGFPEPHLEIQVLGEDKSGTYVPPFLCFYRMHLGTPMKASIALSFIGFLVVATAQAQCMDMPPGPERRECVMSMRGSGGGNGMMRGQPGMRGGGGAGMMAGQPGMGGGRDAKLAMCRERGRALGGLTKDFMRSCMQSGRPGER